MLAFVTADLAIPTKGMPLLLEALKKLDPENVCLVTAGRCTEQLQRELSSFEMKSFGYINDLEYARSFINSRKERKSRKEIYASLCQKGISREWIEKAMEEEYQYEDSKEAIRTLLRKKGYDAEKADNEEKHKVMAYLVRKGFSYEEVRSAMRLDEW